MRHFVLTSVSALCLGWSAFVGIINPVARGDEPAARESPAQGKTEDRGGKTPRPRKRYKGRQIAQTMSFHGAGWLIRTNREEEEDGARMLACLHVAPGQTVVDFGCGNGYHTLRLAQLVGETGRVLAVDIQPEMLRLLEARAQAEGITNVEPILSRQHDPSLPAAQADLILMVDVYHELSYPEEVLRGLRQALRPKGRVVLVEFRAEDPLVPIKPEHKMTRKQVLKELTPNGFKLVEEFDQLPWQHVMFFESDDAATAATEPEDEPEGDDSVDNDAADDDPAPGESGAD